MTNAAPTSAPTATSVEAPYRVSAALFLVATFFFWASLYLYVPILPVYTQTVGASLSMVGVVLAAYAIPQLLFRIPIGITADAIGRYKPLVMVGILMAGLGALGLAVAEGPWQLFFARAVTGLGAASWVTFTVHFASYFPKERSARAISIISFVNGLALVASTYIGGLMADRWGYVSTFVGAVVLGGLSLVAVLPAREAAVRRPSGVSVKRALDVATKPLLLTVSLMSIIVTFATFSGVFGFIPVYAKELGATSSDLGLMTMLSLASSTIAALLAAPLGERWGFSRVLFLGTLLLGGALFATPFVKHLLLLDAVQIANGLGRGLTSTTFLGLAIRAVATEQRATAMGVYQALYSIGMLTGPLLSGVLAEQAGVSSVFYLSAALCAVVASIALTPVVRRA